MRVKEVMNTFFVAKRQNDTVAAVVDAMTDESVGIVCICDERGVPVGVVTDRDIVTRGCARRMDLNKTTIRAIMSEDPLICSADALMSEVETQMERRNVGRVLVVDEQRKLVGLVTLAEIWHSESPLIAGAVSRRVTGRELRVARTGGHYDSSAPPPISEGQRGR